ncbi:TPA: hypothetical protein EYH33_01510 [Candidatus Bipolaricaulota bacterium]|nr:hypothetical protein [Candidatus Bipolaricaulota bacterium]
MSAKTKTNRKRLDWQTEALIAIGAVGLLLVLGFIGALIYALLHASPTALRWWAGLATVALPMAVFIAYHLGRIEARGQIAGLTQGVEAVSRAARDTADIRVTAAHRLRQQPQRAAVQQIFLPGMPPTGGSGVILPPPRNEGEIEL